MTTQEIKSTYSGGKRSYEEVKRQISERFGPVAAAEYNPYQNCLTYRQWGLSGYSVIAGERGLVTFVIVEKRARDGRVTGKYKRKVYVFFKNQVIPKIINK